MAEFAGFCLAVACLTPANHGDGRIATAQVDQTVHGD
jgi:hypothetical protein